MIEGNDKTERKVGISDEDSNRLDELANEMLEILQRSGLPYMGMRNRDAAITIARGTEAILGAASEVVISLLESSPEADETAHAILLAEDGGGVIIAPRREGLLAAIDNVLHNDELWGEGKAQPETAAEGVDEPTEGEGEA